MTGLQLTGTDTEDVERGRSLRNVVFFGGIAAAIFVAGMGYGRVAAQGDILTDHVKSSETAHAALQEVFIRKDGKELAEIIGKIDLLTQKVDALTPERRR